MLKIKLDLFVEYEPAQEITALDQFYILVKPVSTIIMLTEQSR